MPRNYLTVGGTALFPSNTADPSGLNGDAYYNPAMLKFRVFINGAWQNMATDSAIVGSRTLIVDSSNPNATDTRTGLSKFSILYPFRTIQAAMTAAAKSETIWIGPQAYNENVTYSGNNNDNFVILFGTVLNGTFMQAAASSVTTLYLRLIGGGTINGQIGQATNLNGWLRISGDKTGSIHTSDVAVYNNRLEVSGLDVFDTGQGGMSVVAGQTVRIFDCNIVWGGSSSAFDIADIRTYNWTFPNGGQNMLMRNIAVINNLQFPSTGLEHYVQADNVNFQWVAAPNMQNLFKGSFRNCSFYAPSGLTGFTNNPNYYYLWENCQFQFTGATATAITITPNTNTHVFVRNCSSNSTAMINANANNHETGSMNHPNYQILRGF